MCVCMCLPARVDAERQWYQMEACDGGRHSRHEMEEGDMRHAMMEGDMRHAMHEA
jgi:hypothetical protein